MNDEIPPSALASKEYRQLYDFFKDYSIEELSILIDKRKNDIKYSKDEKEIKKLRTEIKILTNIYTINKRKKL